MKQRIGGRRESALVLRALMCAASVVLALSVDAGVASASGGTVQKTVTPKAADGGLASVSCTASNWCMAVGEHALSTGTFVPLAETWNGTKWTDLAIPAPAGSSTAMLEGLSCVSTTFCQAVGFYVTPSTEQFALAEDWNGTSWAIESTPVVSTLIARLDAVSCVSSADCHAVGYQYDSSISQSAVLAESWSGAAWSRDTMADPPSTNYSDLNGIDCESLTSCVAVGVAFGSASPNPTLPVVETLSSGSWSLTSDALPGSLQTASLNGVACQASTCILVGYGQGTGNVAPLALELSGGTISTVSSEVPAGGTYDSFTSVSCSSGTSCLAVGWGETSTSEVLFGEQWNGSTFSLVNMPLPKGIALSGLDSVSCKAGDACVAVGSHESLGIAEVRSTAGKWAEKSAVNPSGSSGADLDKVSCVSTSDCEAVGYYINSSSIESPLIEHWTGKAWTQQTALAPVGSTGTVLTGVSCTSSVFCEAVGYWYNSADQASSFAELYNGGSWTLQSVPTPSGMTGADLAGVSCTSECMAVGSAGNGSTSEVIAETYNGSSWALSSLGAPAGSTYSWLNSISSASDGSCTAVGAGNPGGDGELISESWNGSSWKLGALPVPSGDTSSIAESISCMSSTACVAVGSTEDAGTVVGLSDVLGGSGWTASEVDPSLVYGNLGDVSCTSSTSCTAVGQSSDGTFDYALAETFNGTTWTNASAPQPTGAAFAYLEGVSCTPGVSTCEAVGYYGYWGLTVTLGELLG